MIGVYIRMTCALIATVSTLVLAHRGRWLATFTLWYYAEACAAGSAGGAFHYGNAIVGIGMTLVTLVILIGISYMILYLICKPRPPGRGFFVHWVA